MVPLPFELNCQGHGSNQLSQESSKSDRDRSIGAVLGIGSGSYSSSFLVGRLFSSGLRHSDYLDPKRM